MFNGRAQREAAEIQGWSRVFSVSAVTVLKTNVKCDEAHSEEGIMKKIILAIALTTGFLALSRTNGGDAKKGQLDGAWQLISGQPLPKKHGTSRLFQEDTSFLLLTIRRQGSRFIQAVELSF